MRRDEKDVVVADLQQKLEGASAFYLTDFTGLSVKQITQFRARLRKQGVEYVVVKNTLAKRAIEGMELPNVAGFFSGPTGLVIGHEDAVAAAKVLSDFAREFGDRPAVKVGVVERKSFGPEQVKQLADMPPREVLLAQIAGMLQAPMARLTVGLMSLSTQAVLLLEARRLQLEQYGRGCDSPTLAAIATAIDSWRLQAWLDEPRRPQSEPLKIGKQYTLSVGFKPREPALLDQEGSARIPEIRAELVLLSSSVEFEPAGTSEEISRINVQETTIGNRRMWSARTEIRLVGGGVPDIPRVMIRPTVLDDPRIEMLMFTRGELYREASMILSVEH
jgi:large subunit ribosomal protein L10